jgi:hypothetical protein
VLGQALPLLQVAVRRLLGGGGRWEACRALGHRGLATGALIEPRRRPRLLGEAALLQASLQLVCRHLRPPPPHRLLLRVLQTRAPALLALQRPALLDSRRARGLTCLQLREL